MNKEALYPMLKLNTEDLDTQVALQCAPLLTGMEILNLLTVGRSKRAAALELFEETAVPCCTLYEPSEKIAFLLCIRPALEAYLSRSEVKVLMEHSGYREWGLEEILNPVPIKYEKHMEGCARFPHKISLLLGYPAKGVTEFTEDNGKNFFYVGYRKVYSDLSERKRIFQSYNRTREYIIHMVSRDVKIDAILRIHDLNQYKSTAV